MCSQRHSPVRPFWFCAACVHPWPCRQARAELTAEYADDPKLLAVDMADCLAEATGDLGQLYPTPPNPIEMYGRMLGWIRHLAINKFRDEDGWPN
ncbi:hypothetical protein GCM10027614_53910 [Micromonospora vulcania]